MKTKTIANHRETITNQDKARLCNQKRNPNFEHIHLRIDQWINAIRPIIRVIEFLQIYTMFYVLHNLFFTFNFI